jgi:hypothetical protein
MCRFEHSYAPGTKLSTVPAESHGLISASDPPHVPQNEQLESTVNSAGKNAEDNYLALLQCRLRLPGALSSAA